MCLLVVAWRQHPQWPLIVAGNRDEFHARPTADARWWPDQPDLLGGRDLQAGGTWLAAHRSGRFATVTNYRDAQQEPASYRSRGDLVTGFLLGGKPATGYLDAVDGSKYAGFNLLVFDGDTLAYSSNRADEIRRLPPGIYGQSNALLDADWHKVRRSKTAMQSLMDTDRVNETELFRLLDDRKKAPVASIEDGRLDFETRHAISAPFIVLPDYGTRCSTVVMHHANGNVRFHERRFDASGTATGDAAFSYTCAA